ncbi:MAG: ferritin family protein [Syntrophomonadaceae bacterium]|nr:ferritin family protein [Syntrophomonadaceae bacterium]
MAIKELELLKVAILNEVEGETFYRLAAEHLGQGDIQALLLHLADEEAKHQETLRKLYAELAAGKEAAVEGLNLDRTPSTGIFDLMKLGRVNSNLEISVVSTGILMEKASMDYYNQAAEQSESKAIKDLCQYLARWEREHLEKLEKIYDYLQAEWFEAQGFSTS